MDHEERILEILCNRCNCENDGFCEQCEKEGDYKEAVNFMRKIREGIWLK